MRYGNCVSYKNIEHIKILKDAGFDYIETALSSFKPASEQEISEFLSVLDENNLKCEAVNVLFPGGIALTGETVEFEKAKDYIDEIFEKTKNIGFKSVVFGSGGARKYPDGFPKEKAVEQIIKIINDYLIPAAEKYGFILAIEELNRGETNIINTIDEAEYIINQIKNPKVKLLADLYHIAVENDDVAKLSEKGGILEHCHIANPYNNRFYPHKTDSDKSINLYKQFFASLESAGYNGKMSIEGGLGGFSDLIDVNVPDWVNEEDKKFYIESKKSLEFMKSLN